MIPLLIALLAVSQGAQAKHPDWVRGRWILLNPGEHLAQPCNADGDDQIVYSRRGYWVGITLGEYGRWWIEDDHFFEQMIDAGESGDAQAIGKTRALRFRMAREGEVRFADGSRMFRCGRDVEGWFPYGKRY